MTDYRTILIKYIWVVGQAEGVDFISDAQLGTGPRDFTAEELAALGELGRLPEPDR